MENKRVVLLGSRRLPAGGAAVIGRLVAGALGASWSLSVGCASGADRAAVRAALRAGAADRLRVYAVGGPDGRGYAGRASAFAGVLSASLAGASVRWWSAGPVSRPLRSRLVGRSIAAVRSAVEVGISGGAVVGVVDAPPPHAFAPPHAGGVWLSCGSGSWSALGAAALSGVRQVLVVPVGGLAGAGAGAGSLPELPGGPGRWAPVNAGIFAGALEWVPDSIPF